MEGQLKKVDHSALRVNQAVIIILLVIGFVINSPWLVAITGLVMLIGSSLRQPGFKTIYTGFLKPRRIVAPDVIMDNPEPHVFAQAMGGTVLALSVIAFLVGGALVGWILAWVVIALAALNLFVGFCAGCFVYYWLSRLHAPGFGAIPIEGTFPGMRPSHKAG